MKKHRLLMLMFASAAFIISCEKDAMMSGSNSQIIPDPVGTIIANVSNNYQTEQYIFSAIPIQIDGANNFTTPNGWLPGLAIASVGEVAGIGNITSIPQTGWSSSVAVIPSYGYVVATPWQENGNIDYDHLQYARIYVVDYIVGTSGGIIGATIKYQSPFIP